MMETPRAASPLNIDAPPQIKLGKKADKFDGEEKKSDFKDALDQQGTSKAKGKDLLETPDATGGEATPALETNADGTLKTGSDPARTVPAGAKKPLILLTAQLGKPAPQKGDFRTDESSGFPAPETAGIKRLARTISTTDAAAQQTADKDDATATGGDTLALDAAAPVNKVHRHGKHANGSRAEISIDDQDLKIQNQTAVEAPAKDALGLLQGRMIQHGSEATGITRSLEGADGEKSMVDPADTDPGTGSTRSYRLSRADGKGGVLDIPGPDMPSDDAAGTTTTTAASVTVLDQRRFLAPAQDNALSVINSISGDHEWTSAMHPESALANAASVAGGGKVVNTLKIQMHPIDLGLVTATLRLSGEELTVDLRVETGAAYRQLKEDQSRIVDALKSQGFNVDQVTVIMAPERSEMGNNASANQSGGQGAAFAQQQSRDGGQGAAAGRERRIFEQERTGNGSTGMDDNRVETGGLRGPGGTRSGDVYL